MGKGKKGGKRMNKRQVTDLLVSYFQSQPNVELSYKQIFRALHFDTHPLKMLAIEVMEELAWDDFLSKTSVSSYSFRSLRLNQTSFGGIHSGE